MAGLSLEALGGRSWQVQLVACRSCDACITRAYDIANHDAMFVVKVPRPTIH